MGLVVNLGLPLTFVEEIFVTGRAGPEDVVTVQHTLPREGEITFHKR